MSLLKTLALTCTVLVPTSALADWNGWYGGLAYGQFSNGTFDSELSPGADDEITDSDAIGGYIGSMSQSGNLVFGYEFAFSTVEDVTVAALPGAEVESPLFDIKYRIGYAIDNLQPYGVIGLSATNIQGGGNDLPTTGFGFGAGLDVALGENVIVGLEYLYRTSNDEVTNGISTGDLDVTSELIMLRIGFKF